MPAFKDSLCITSVQKILEHGLPFSFTDGHAVAGLSHFYGTNEVKDIETLLDFDAIKVKRWKSEEDFDLK